MGFVAPPTEERWHRRPTALLGGPALVLSALLPPLVLLGRLPTAAWVAFGAGAVAVAAVGLLDDVYRLSAVSKLIVQFALASLPVSFGFSIPRLHPVLSVVVSMIWIVGITNAMNLLDNMDGLSAGVGAVAASVLAVNALGWGNPLLAGWAAALAGACLGFLLYNFHPASIFMGDSGSLFLGYSLGVLSLIDLKARPVASMASLAVPVFALLVPIFDTTLVTVARLLAGRSPAQGGRDHTSHRLVSLGITERKAVLILWLLAAVSGGVSLAFQRLPATLLALVTFLAVLAVYYFGAYLGSLPVYQDDPTSLSRARSSGFVLLDTFVAYKTRIVEVSIDIVLVCASYLTATVVRSDGILTGAGVILVTASLPVLIVLRLVSFVWAGVYRNIPGAFHLTDFLAIVRGTLMSSVAFAIFLAITGRFQIEHRVVVLLDTILVMAAVSFSRIATRSIAEILDPFRERAGRRVLVIGAGQLGEATARLLRYDGKTRWQIIGFLDDSVDKIGRRLQGKRVLGPLADLPKMLDSSGLDEVVLAIASVDGERRREIRDRCERNGVMYREIGFSRGP